MITRRRIVLALAAGAFAPLASFSQQPATKVYRVGLLSPASASSFAPRVEALRAGLRDLGYIEGKNTVIEFRWAEGKYDRLPELAAELIGLKVDVLVTHAGRATKAAKSATTTIPIVMVSASDPDADGTVASLQRPGGNVTGLANFNLDLTSKRLELLKDSFPRVKRVAFLFNPENNIRVFRAAEIAAKSLQLELQQFDARGLAEFDGVFAAMTKSHVDAVAVAQETVFFGNYKRIAELAERYRLPSVGSNEYAEAGGMLGYQSNPLELYQRAAYFVDKILKGAKPGDLPVERPTRFELVINLKTAKSLGIRIPQSLLQRADKVIE